MTTDELLCDRYKVIADYFYNPYKIGDIITVLYEDRSVLMTRTSHRDEFGETVNTDHYFHPNRLKDFPHLFQPLPWYAERELSDMPEYVKSKGVIYKVKKWTGSFQNIQWIGCYVHGDIIFIYSDDLQPASLADYEAYQQSKNK